MKPRDAVRYSEIAKATPGIVFGKDGLELHSPDRRGLVKGVGPEYNNHVGGERIAVTWSDGTEDWIAPCWIEVEQVPDDPLGR